MYAFAYATPFSTLYTEEQHMGYPCNAALFHRRFPECYLGNGRSGVVLGLLQE